MKYSVTFLLLVVSFALSKCESANPPNRYSNITKLNNSVHSKTFLFENKCKHISSTNETITSRTIPVDKVALEKYIKNIDLTVIPGFVEDKGITSWVPSNQIKTDLPTYMTGFDRQNRPIWVYEYGRQNFYKYASGGKEMQALFHRYNRWCTYTCVKYMAFKSTKENPVNQYVVILDFEGLKAADILNITVLEMLLKQMSDFRRWTEKRVAKLVVINVNSLSENLLNIGRYFVLRVLGKLDIYGTNKSFWVPQLLRTFPKDQIPEKYGGCKGVQPINFI